MIWNCWVVLFLFVFFVLFFKKRRQTMVPYWAAVGLCSAFADNAEKANHCLPPLRSVWCYAKSYTDYKPLAYLHINTKLKVFTTLIVSVLFFLPFLQWLGKGRGKTCIKTPFHQQCPVYKWMSHSREEMNTKLARNTQEFLRAAEMINNQY